MSSASRARLSTPKEAISSIRVVANKLVRTPVQVGTGVNLTRVEILSGLTEKDTVALSAANNHELTNGLPVKDSRVTMPLSTYLFRLRHAFLDLFFSSAAHLLIADELAGQRAASAGPHG